MIDQVRAYEGVKAPWRITATVCKNPFNKR